MRPKTQRKSSLMELKQLWLMTGCEPAPASHRRSAHAKEGSGRKAPLQGIRQPGMAHSKPLMAQSSGTDSASEAIASGLRTLDAEASGIAAISAALLGSLGPVFAAA